MTKIFEPFNIYVYNIYYCTILMIFRYIIDIIP